MLLIRILALPILPIFALIVLIRNWSYDRGYLASNKFDIPIICIGNLSVGGTGKTPHTEYVVNLIKDEVVPCVISRGYKRKTKGYLEVLPDMTASQTGDEPLQIKRKFPNAYVAVAEERLNGITNVLIDHEEIDVIILDDAFQHRAVRAGLNVLLTTYDEPFFDDKLMPFGNLREFKKGAKRADILVITKCPDHLKTEEMNKFKEQASNYGIKSIYFSKISYGHFIDLMSHETLDLSSEKVVLVTGIAEPKPMTEFLDSKGVIYEHLAFRDHHAFSSEDITKIKELFDTFEAKRVLCTEKDAVRLKAFSEKLKELNMPVCFLNITISFIDEGSQKFNDEIVTYVRDNKDNHRTP